MGRFAPGVQGTLSVGDRVRRIYELRPYPPASLREEGLDWALPPVDWLRSVWSLPANGPARILVAGCGVGTEAFGFARRFPSAEVVGVDFSPRSIATARRLRRSIPGGNRVTFEIADLADPRLIILAGGRFDVVSCHGVLSYVTKPASVLRNLFRCLTPFGALILGVNGAKHASLAFRLLLSDFGIDPEEFRESKKLRDVLSLFDTLTGYQPPVAKRVAGYLSGDLFGPLNVALPLLEWNNLCRQRGFHLLGSYQAHFAVRSTLNADLLHLLMPRSRAQVAELLDALQPESFHRLVFSRRPPAEPPWLHGKRLLRWLPILTPLYSIHFPEGGGPWHHLREVTLKSSSINTKVKLRVPQWEVEILRGSNGKRSLRELLDRVKPGVPAKSLGEAMYLLYQLGAVNLLPGFS